MPNFVKTVTESGTCLFFKALFTVIICTVGWKTIQISFFSLAVMGTESFESWRFWANTGLGAVLMGFGSWLVGSTWEDIKKRFKRKE